VKSITAVSWATGRDPRALEILGDDALPTRRHMQQNARPMAKTATKLAPRSAPATRTAIPGVRAQTGAEKSEHRNFPRADIRTKCVISIRGHDDEATFSANLESANLSVSGVFLESTFFLPVGQELHVEFELPQEKALVRARGVIVREERADGSRGRSGFAIRFLEFFDQTEVALAKVFLGVRLKNFSAEYLKSRRAKNLGSELDRLTDALAAWELLKITAGHDVWEA
jgi:hypothetical protein